MASTVKAHRRGKSQVKPYVRGGHGPAKKKRVTLPAKPTDMAEMAAEQPMAPDVM